MEITQTIEQLLFLGGWLLLPLILEIIPAIFSGTKLLLKIHRTTHPPRLAADNHLPRISLIVPVHNSAKTLRACLKSIHTSKYPHELLEVFVINNGSSDNSEQIFYECVRDFKTLAMRLVVSPTGKSRAINAALQNVTGEFVISIDSDGTLHPNAIRNMVNNFKSSAEIQCMSAVILIDPTTISSAKSRLLRVIKKLEVLEYCQTFLAGRNIESSKDQIYTSAGACTGFRLSALLSTDIYNSHTICEDTDITFAIREKFPKGIRLCPNAYFFTESIESLNALYVQRKRWQKGELEIANLYLKPALISPLKFWSDFRVRLLFYDHTFAFPRMIWGVTLICLVFIGYNLKTALLTSVILYAIYVLIAFWYYNISLKFLQSFPTYKILYKNLLPYILLMPLYSILLFWFRISGFFMQTTSKTAWHGPTLTQEFQKIKSIILHDLSPLISLHHSLFTKLN